MNKEQENKDKFIADFKELCSLHNVQLVHEYTCGLVYDESGDSYTDAHEYKTLIECDVRSYTHGKFGLRVELDELFDETNIVQRSSDER